MQWRTKINKHEVWVGVCFTGVEGLYIIGFRGFPAQVCLIGTVLYGDNVVVKCLRVENARPLAGTLVWDGVSLLEYQAGTPGSFVYILKKIWSKLN